MTRNATDIFWLGYVFKLLVGIIDGQDAILFCLVADILKDNIPLNPEHPRLQTSFSLPLELTDMSENLYESILQQVFGYISLTYITKAYAEQPPGVHLIQFPLGIAVALPAFFGYLFFLAQS